MMIQRVGALTGNTPQPVTTVKQATPSFEGVNVRSAGKTMKALTMAAVAMSGCAQPTDPTPIEQPTSPTDGTTGTEGTETTTPAVVQTPVQAELVKMFKTLGLIPSSEVSARSAYTPVKGDVESLAYTNQAGEKFNYTINKELSNSDETIFEGFIVDNYGDYEGDFTSTVKKTSEGLLKHDSYNDYAQLFVDEGDCIQKYYIDDKTGNKEKGNTYKQDPTDSTKIRVSNKYFSDFCYEGFNLTLAE